MSRSAALVATVAAVSMLGTGCLQQTYRISHNELQRLAMTPPEERGRAVRVTQELGNQDPAPEATPVTGDTEIVFIQPIEIDPYHPYRPTDVHGTGGGAGGGPHGGGAHLGQAASSKDEAWVYIIVAVAAVVALAATEGSRYDGWVQMHPMMPVHLWGPGGYIVRPLAQIDPATAAWAQRAVVRPTEGPWREIGRAPLDRAGWTYSVLGGGGTLVSGDGSRKTGASTHIQLGYFPQHMIGIQADVDLGWRPNAINRTLFQSKWSVELDVAPLDAGPLHVGGFGTLGVAARQEDGITSGNGSSTSTSLGAIVQLGITTRLAITGRAGIGKDFGQRTTDLTVGLSIY